MLAPGLAQDQRDYILPFTARARTMGLGLRHLWVLRKKKQTSQNPRQIVTQLAKELDLNKWEFSRCPKGRPSGLEQGRQGCDSGLEG